MLLKVLPPAGPFIKCNTGKRGAVLGNGRQVAALRRAEGFGDSMKKARGGKRKGKERKGGGGGKNTEAGDEARNEKGRAVFSFHVMKHLLWLRTSPAEPSLV